MKQINIGIIGPGKIAPRFIKGAEFLDGVSIKAVYGRTYDKAKAFAKAHKIEKVYEHMDDLLNDENIHMVYIATPIMVHQEQILAALRAKKHVLCEKPMLVRENDINEAFALADEMGVLLMEAQKAPYLGSTLWVKEALANQMIGQVTYMEASYGYRGNFDDDHWVFDPYGGGSLWDVGVYPIAFFLSVIDDEIESFSKKVDLHKRGADQFAHLQIQTKKKLVASLSSSLIADQVNRARIYGTEGMIIIDNFWKSNSLKVIMHDGDIKEIHFDDPSDFTPYIKHALECIEKGLTQSPLYNQKHSLLQVQLITST